MYSGFFRLSFCPASIHHTQRRRHLLVLLLPLLLLAWLLLSCCTHGIPTCRPVDFSTIFAPLTLIATFLGFLTVTSQVFRQLRDELEQRNWVRHQGSNWYKTGPGVNLLNYSTFDAQAVCVCAAAENLCGLQANPPPPNHIFH